MRKQTLLLVMTNIIGLMISSCYGFSTNSKNNSNGLNSQTTSQPKKGEKTEWAQWLDRYEDLVERNNTLQSRVKSGDMNATQEVVSLSQELMEVSQKCQENQSSMSVAEVKRIMEIMQKIKY